MQPSDFFKDGALLLVLALLLSGIVSSDDDWRPGGRPGVSVGAGARDFAQPPPPSGDPLFLDTLETHSTGACDTVLSFSQNGIAWGGNRFCSVSSQLAHSGSKSLKFSYDASPDEWQELRFTLPDMPEIWIQYWIYPLDGTEGFGSRVMHQVSGNPNNKAIRLFNNGQTGYTDVNYLKMGASFSNPDGSGDDALVCEARNGQGGDMSVICQEGENGIGNNKRPAEVYIARGTWTRLTWHFKPPTSANNDGITDYWYNGALAAENHGVPGWPQSGQPLFSDGYLMGWANVAWAASGTTAFYLDDVMMDDKPDNMCPLDGVC